jgi:hypothetical protein
MKFEYELKRSLNDVPELPPDLFKKIEKKVATKHKRTVFYYSIAASLLLFLGALSFIAYKPVLPVYTVENEVAEELQTIHDYVNGNDLDNDIEMYAIINNY